MKCCHSESVRQALLAFLAPGWMLSALSASAAEPAPPLLAPDAGANRTLSESGQFSITGGSAPARSQVGTRGDHHWKEFTKLLGIPLQWRHRIIVQVHDRAASVAPQVRVVGQITPVPGGYRFQVDLLQDEDFRWDDYRRELTKLFLFSQVIGANSNRAIRDRFPQWLVAGLHTLLNYRQNGMPNEFFAALLNTRQMLSFADLLKAEPTQFQDSVSSGVLSACGAALVQSLLSQPNGRVRFLAWLNDVATTDQSALQLLQQHFPPLRQEPGALEQWWTGQITGMSKPSTYVVLSLRETEERLEQLLLVQPRPAAPPPEAGAATSGSNPSPEPKKSPKTGWLGFLRKSTAEPQADPQQEPFEPAAMHVRDYEKFLKQPWAKDALRDAQSRLVLLQANAFPLYQSVLSGYHQVLHSLLENRTKGCGDLLNRLEQERRTLQQEMLAIEDHLNWFSTTQIEGMTQEFDGYSRALQLLERLDQRKRPDPISRYLDAIERELNP